LWINLIVLTRLGVFLKMNLWIFGFKSGWTMCWLKKATVKFCIVLWHNSHKLSCVFVSCQDTIHESHCSFYKQWVAFFNTTYFNLSLFCFVILLRCCVIFMFFTIRLRLIPPCNLYVVFLFLDHPPHTKMCFILIHYVQLTLYCVYGQTIMGCECP